MVFLEIILITIGLAAILSAIDFIAKTTSNITHSLGLPEYLTSTIILSFIVVVPIFLMMHLSNAYDAPALGLSTAMGFALTLVTLVMGVFLLKNELPVEYEGYRNATFMWASALLLLVVSFDQYIDRMDAIFLLLLFAFYVVYIVYRTSKSKEYVYLKQVVFNRILYPVSIMAILISSWFVVYSALNLATNFNLPLAKMGFIVFGLLFALPLFDIIPSIFRSSRLTFDNILGTVVVCLTLVPASAAIITPLPLNLGGEIGMIPLIMLNVATLIFALATRFTYTLHKKMGVFLIILYIISMVNIFFV
jgi:cation:H+ antiporter